MKKTYKSYRLNAILLMSFLFSFKIVLAQDTTATKTKATNETKANFYVSFGVYQPSVTTLFAVNGNKGPAAVLSLEQNLGFDANPILYRTSASISFKRHSSVELTYIQLNRNNNWDVDREVKIFDSVFDVGAKINLFVNTTFIAATYKYSIFRKPTWYSLPAS
jgi:hypothetical protein